MCLTRKRFQRIWYIWRLSLEMVYCAWKWKWCQNFLENSGKFGAKLFIIQIETKTLRLPAYSKFKTITNCNKTFIQIRNISHPHIRISTDSTELDDIVYRSVWICVDDSNRFHTWHNVLRFAFCVMRFASR